MRLSSTVAIDGRLDEPVWRDGAPATAFRQVEPREGASPSERTEVRIAYDADALYIAARMFDADPAGIVARLGRRDAETNSDYFGVFIDSYHDHRSSFRFFVNAAGVRLDDVTSSDESAADASWDPVWETAARVDEQGWTVEIRIPLSQLRFSGAADQEWGINFERYIQRRGELVRWSWVPNSETGYASRFGHLVGLRDLAAARSHRMEIMPYAVSQGDFETGVDRDDPFHRARRGRTTVGADFKYGLSAGLTLTGTINPDFGQVEADPAEVNLTVYETYFQERRPFFVEGASLFAFPPSAFGAPELFYSRRIGRPPAGGVPDDVAFADVPEVTAIRGAAKLSGKVGAWSIALLDAVTAKERADVLGADDLRGTVPVEPRTNYAVLGLQRDFRNGASGLGLLATSVLRDIDTVSLRFLRGSAHSGGVDFFHRFARDQFRISGTVTGSLLRGDSSSIIAAQRSSARYYQRPDQSYAPFDIHAKSMSGYNVSFSGGKVAGRWLYGTDFIATSPGFEINDLGYQQSADRIFHGLRLSHRWLRPTRLTRFAQAYVNESNSWNYGGTRVTNGVFTGLYAQLLNYWSFSLDGVVNAASLNDRVTRGGPLALVPAQWSLYAYVASDPRRPITGSVNGNLTRNRSGGFANNLTVEIGGRPTSALEVTFAPAFRESHSAAGYVAAPPDAEATTTYGRRYIVADLHQRELDLTFRADMALTSALSLQLYTQPYAAAAAYSGYKAFARPREFQFLVYGRDAGSTLSYDEEAREYAVDADGAGPAPDLAFPNPDFRLRSLRTNLVLRWEYRAGSTLYLAWAHGRGGSAGDPSFDIGRDLRDLWHDDQRNRLLIKASYWFNP